MGLSQFQKIESLLKTKQKNTFYFMFKALFNFELYIHFQPDFLVV